MSEEPTQQPEDLFSQDNVITSNIAKWDKVGKSYQGVFVERTVRVGSKFDPDKVSAVYTIIQDDGTSVQVYGKMPVKQMVDGKEQEINIVAGLENAKPGQYVGVKFIEERKPASGSGFPTKIVQAFSKGVMNLEVLENYNKSKAGIPTGVEDDEPAVPEM